MAVLKHSAIHTLMESSFITHAPTHNLFINKVFQPSLTIFTHNNERNL